MNLRSIVDEQRKQSEQERLFHIASGVRKILKGIDLQKNKLLGDLEELEKVIGKYAEAIGPYWAESWIKAIHKQLGDPKEMASAELKQIAKPYWNPTTHNINITPLGIVRSYDNVTKEVAYYNTLAPGEMLMVPWSHTIGGKHSAIKGIAPQLQPLPNFGTPDQYEEINPLTYVEWCEFGSEHNLSQCCNKQILWSDNKNKLVCQRCGDSPL